MRNFFRLISAIAVLSGATAPAGESAVLIFGPENSVSAALKQELANREIPARIGGGTELAGVKLLIVPPGVRLDETVRRQLPEFFRDGGGLIAMGPENFGAGAPQPGRIKPLPELDPAAGDWECRGSKIMRRRVFVGPNARRFLELKSEEMREGSIFIRYKNLAGKIDRSDRLLLFRACGDHESRIVSVSVTDSDGNQFVSHADLEREWQDYVLRFADFVPLAKGENSDYEFGGPGDATLLPPPARKLDPGKIVSIAIGLSNRHLWWDKPGRLHLADVAVAADLAGDDERSGYAMRYEVPYSKVGLALGPDWFDPFDGAMPAADPMIHVTPWSREVLQSADEMITAPGAVRVPPRPFIRGREADDKSFTESIRKRADRRIPLLLDAENRPVAEVILPADELNPTGAAAVFGLPAAIYEEAPAARQLFGATADYLLSRPQLSKIFIDLTGPPEKTAAVAIVRLTNPAAATVTARLTLTVDRLPEISGTVDLPPGRTLETELPFPEIPADFPFTDFSWRLSLASSQGNDFIAGRIDAKSTLEYLINRMLELQKTHADGRISHHYFSDVYGARALVAVGLRANRPELVKAGERLLEGITTRQFAEGALPMGYGEARRIGWVADNGTAVLALVQLASFLPEKRDHYLAVVKRYYDWRETFHHSPAKVEELEAKYGKSGSIRPGIYGIGYNDGPFFEKGKTDETIRVERGYPWVLGISMVSLPGYYQLTGDREILAIAERNLRDYLPTTPEPNYFGGEALYWMYRYLPDRELARRAADRLRDGFVPAALRDRGFIAFERGGRKTLDMLTLLYYWRDFEDSPRLRAALLKHIWNHADPASPFSVYRVGDGVRHSSHGYSIAAARYAGTVSSVWLAEWLYPGCTMLKEAELKFPVEMEK